MRLVAYRAPDGEIAMGVQRGQWVYPLDSVAGFFADVAHSLEKAREVAGQVGLDINALQVAVPVPSTARVFCVGLNYREHAEEAKMATSERPNIFGRWSTTLIAHGEVSQVPAGDWRYDWEGELAAVVGATIAKASPSEAEARILGYTCFNDLSAREYQLAVSQWTVGKNADRSGPIGPAIVTPDEIGDPYALELQTRVNGEVVQRACTAQIIHRAPEILSYLSQIMTIAPGDVLALGTPAGIGHKRNPPRYLKPGDSVEVEIERIGVLRTVVA